MSDLRFTEDHKWLRNDGAGRITIGITHYAQEQLGDIVYVELPQAGSTVTAGKDAAIVESVKAAGEINVPINGTVMAVNERLNYEPELVNTDPMGEGWFIKVQTEEQGVLARLMDESAYNEFIKSL